MRVVLWLVRERFWRCCCCCREGLEVSGKRVGRGNGEFGEVRRRWVYILRIVFG